MSKIFPRFSLSLRSIHVGGGIVNAEYIGKIRVILTNLPNNRVEFTAGDRFAQLLFQKKKDVIFYGVLSFDDHTTERRSGGFGSIDIYYYILSVFFK